MLSLFVVAWTVGGPASIAQALDPDTNGWFLLGAMVLQWPVCLLGAFLGLCGAILYARGPRAPYRAMFVCSTLAFVAQIAWVVAALQVHGGGC